jgi:aspartate carbamoyltransferase regulatory subunit
LNEHFQNAVRNGYQFGKDVIASNFGEGDTSGGLYDDAVEPIDVLEYTNGRVLTLVVPKSKTGEKNNNDIIAIDDMDITKQQTAVLVLTGDTSIFNDDEEEEEVRKCRRLPADATGPIECSTSRGLVAIRCGNNRFIVLDLEEDEEDEDDDDREDE